MALEAAVGLWASCWWAGDMNTPEPGFVCPVGPVLEWLEPKLPDILKNGGTLPSITKDDGKTEGTVLEPLEMDSIDNAGVRFALSKLLFIILEFE